LKNLHVFFGSGAIGGLVNSLALWLLGQQGITHTIGVSIAPALTPQWLYPRIVWGGIWGITFILPFMKSRLIAKGLVLSLLPTAFQLFYVFPQQGHAGMMGMGLGQLTPVLVVVLNMVWGLVAGLSISVSK
jgi:hypothetical protein